jgi:uncharacterized membrane protein YozB (DUF420 family)
MSLAFKFMILYFANLVLDYPLQGDFLGNYKSKSWYVLFVHASIWGLGVSLALFYLDLFAWWKVIMLVGGHFIIDAWKCRGWHNKQGLSEMGAYFIDQFLHVVQILIALVV